VEFWSSFNPIWRKTPDWVVKVRLREKIVQVSSGKSHHLFLTDEGTVYSCGSNATCALGIQSTNGPIGYPTRVELDVKVKQIACGEEHSCLLTDSGRLYVCGMNTSGCFGLPDFNQSPTFLLCSSLMRYKISKVACGPHYTLALTEEGKIIGMGDSEHYQLLIRESCCTAPRLLKTLVNYRIVDIACSEKYVVVLTDDGRVITWGEEIFGRQRNLWSTPQELNLDLPGRVVRIIGGTNCTWFVCDTREQDSPAIISFPKQTTHKLSPHSVTATSPDKHSQDPVQLMKSLNVKLQIDVSKLIRMQISFKSLCKCMKHRNTSRNLLQENLDDCSKSLQDKKRITDVKALALSLLTNLESWKIDREDFTQTKIVTHSLCTNIGEWCRNLSQWIDYLGKLDSIGMDADNAEAQGAIAQILRTARNFASVHEEASSLLKVISTLATHLIQHQTTVSPVHNSVTTTTESRNPPTLALVSRNASPLTLPVRTANSSHKHTEKKTVQHGTLHLRSTRPGQNIQKHYSDDESIDLTENFDENISEHGSMISSTMIDDITQSFLEQDQMRAFETSLNITLSHRMQQFDSSISERMIRFTQQLSRAKRSVHLTKRIIQEHNEQLSQQKIHLSHLQAENERLRSENRQKSQACTQLEVDYIEIKKSNIQVKQSLEEKITRLTNGQSQTDEEISSLQFQYASLKEKCEALERDKVVLREKLDTAHGEKNQLSEWYYMLQASAESNTKDRDAEIEDLSRELRDAREKCNHISVQHQSDLCQIYTHISTVLGRQGLDSSPTITFDDVRSLCDEALGPSRNQEIAALEQRFYKSEIERKDAEAKIKYLETELKHKDDVHNLLLENQGRNEVYEKELRHAMEKEISLVKVRKELELELSRVHASLIEEQQKSNNLSASNKDLKTEITYAKETMSDMQKQFEEEIFSLRSTHHDEQQSSEVEYNQEKNSRDQQLQLLETQLAAYQASEEELEGKIEVYCNELNRVLNREHQTSQIMHQMDVHCRSLVNHLKVFDSYVGQLLRQVQTALHISSPSKKNYSTSGFDLSLGGGDTTDFGETELTFSQVHSSPLKEDYSMQRLEFSDDMDLLLKEARRKLTALDYVCSRPAKSSYKALERLMQCVQELLHVMPENDFDLQHVAQSLEASVELMNSLHR